MSPTLSSLLARSCLENNLRKSSVLLPLALYIKYTNGRVLRGVDALAEESARRYDMSVCIIILPTHSCTVCITPLTESMLHEGLQHVLRANKTLQCPLPNNVLKTGCYRETQPNPTRYWEEPVEACKWHWSNRNPCASTQTSGTNLTTLNRDLSHVTHPTNTPKTLPSWEADASFFKWHKNYTIYFGEPFSWKLDRCWIFGFINIVKNGRIKKEWCNKSLTLFLLSSLHPYSKRYIFLLPFRPYILHNCTLHRNKIWQSS